MNTLLLLSRTENVTGRVVRKMTLVKGSPELNAPPTGKDHTMCCGPGNKHSWMMLLGCLGPLLLIFLLPTLGVREGWILPIALGAMLLSHLVMAGFSWRRGGHEDHSNDDRPILPPQAGDIHAHH